MVKPRARVYDVDEALANNARVLASCSLDPLGVESVVQFECASVNYDQGGAQGSFGSRGAESLRVGD